MPFNARQIFMIAMFAIFWTAFMLWWNGDYGTTRTADVAIGVGIALAWEFSDEEVRGVEGGGVRMIKTQFRIYRTTFFHAEDIAEVLARPCVRLSWISATA